MNRQRGGMVGRYHTKKNLQNMTGGGGEEWPDYAMTITDVPVALSRNANIGGIEAAINARMGPSATGRKYMVNGFSAGDSVATTVNIWRGNASSSPIGVGPYNQNRYREGYRLFAIHREGPHWSHYFDQGATQSPEPGLNTTRTPIIMAGGGGYTSGLVNLSASNWTDDQERTLGSLEFYFSGLPVHDVFCSDDSLRNLVTRHQAHFTGDPYTTNRTVSSNLIVSIYGQIRGEALESLKSSNHSVSTAKTLETLQNASTTPQHFEGNYY